MTPRVLVTNGKSWGGGGGAAVAFHCSPDVPYLVCWGRWRRQATALQYALGKSDAAQVGALELVWPIGVQDADGGLFVLLVDSWGDSMYAKSERSAKSAGRR